MIARRRPHRSGEAAAGAEGSGRPSRRALVGTGPGKAHPSNDSFHLTRGNLAGSRSTEDLVDSWTEVGDGKVIGARVGVVGSRSSPL